MAVLVVPTPSLDFKAVDPGIAVIEKPVEIKCGPVLFPDGSTFSETDLGTSGFFIYRMNGVGSSEVWNDQDKRWSPDPGPGVTTLKPKTLIIKKGASVSWGAPLVAAGQKDQNDDDQFQRAAPLFPQYFFRAYFSATKNGAAFSGLSSPSAPLRFIGSLDAIRAGIRAGDDETPEDATEVSLFLRDSSRRYLGTVQIFSESGGARIEIANRQGGSQKARIRLLSSGDVEIQPAPGREIILLGPAIADRIFYQPANAAGAAVGPKQWLP